MQTNAAKSEQRPNKDELATLKVFRDALKRLNDPEIMEQIRRVELGEEYNKRKLQGERQQR